MFVMIQSSFIIAYRYVDYFKIYFELFFAEVFVCMIKKNVHLKLCLNCVRCVLLFLPILFVNVSYFFEYQYNPYSSIIEKSVFENRENRYKELGPDLYYYPKSNEY